ncbi:MAG TPA: ATPase domain-containing protein [Xanthomonadaceae bacterium]|nr:ATPase domain-containing protein [Xanthomonadaceae bacterium]
MTTPAREAPPREEHVSTGIAGLDLILDGGLTADRMYLVEGVPGSGKTTLALQFLREGVARGETVLFVSLSETEEELREVAASHGWALDGIHIHELDAHHARGPEADYTMFHPSEVELGETTRRILDAVERLRPQRVVFDSLAELRLLSGAVLRFRRQVLALKQYFAGRRSTVLLLDEAAQVAEQGGLHVHTLVHGVISLDQLRPDFGGDRRRLRIGKMRGRNFVSGYHDYKIITGGVCVYPRLIAAQHRREGSMAPMTSGLAPLDALLGGGLDRGTSSLVIGPAGTGKSTLATQFVMAAAERGEPSAVFIFDESQRAFVTRSRGLGFDIDRHIDAGLVKVQPIDPAELTPGEFVHAIRAAAEEDGVRVVVIDSLNGYLNAMPGERYMLVQLHELLNYLGQLGVTTLLIAAQQGLIGQTTNPVDVSYLSDGVVLLRYFEAEGEVRKAISVLKKRTGFHEQSIRELRMGPDGVRLSEPLRQFRGVLTGLPFDEANSAPAPA